jgi:hypothetical protein
LPPHLVDTGRDRRHHRVPRERRPQATGSYQVAPVYGDGLRGKALLLS